MDRDLHACPALQMQLSDVLTCADDGAGTDSQPCIPLCVGAYTNGRSLKSRLSASHEPPGSCGMWTGSRNDVSWLISFVRRPPHAAHPHVCDPCSSVERQCSLPVRTTLSQRA